MYNIVRLKYLSYNNTVYSFVLLLEIVKYLEKKKAICLLYTKFKNYFMTDILTK